MKDKEDWRSVFALVSSSWLCGEKLLGWNAPQLGPESMENSRGSLHNLDWRKSWMLAQPQTHPFKGRVRSTHYGSGENNPPSLFSSFPLLLLRDELQICPRPGTNVHTNDFPSWLSNPFCSLLHCFVFRQDTTGKQTLEHVQWHCLHEHAQAHESRFHPLALTANCIFQQLWLFERNVPLCEKYLIDDCLDAFCFVSFVIFSFSFFVIHIW